MIREFDHGNNHDAPLGSNEGAYLQEIGRFPLLTAEEEILLSRQVHRGLQLVRPTIRANNQQVPTLAGCDPTTYPPEEAQILEQAMAAKRHMTESNLLLVVSIAKRYLGRGMSFLDLVQEGNLGLMHAVEKFDPERGNRFSTYATWWIRQGVTRGIADQARTIRVPVHVTDGFGKIVKAERFLQQTSMTEKPTAAATAKFLGGKFTPSKVEDIREHLSPIASLDYPKEDSPQSVLGDAIEDPLAHQGLVETAEHGDLKDRTATVLASLNGRERFVIEMRYGIRGGQAHTLEQIGGILGVTRERIRQIEEKALRKLRHPARSKKLRDYLDL